MLLRKLSVKNCYFSLKVENILTLVWTLQDHHLLRDRTNKEVLC